VEPLDLVLEQVTARERKAGSGTEMKSVLVNTTEARIDTRIDSFWRIVETSIYVAVACVIAVTAAIALLGCGFVLWQGLHTWNSWDAIVYESSVSCCSC
jgi:hypothetical protein